MQIEKINHLETMIGSLNKLLLDAKNKGIIRNKELSLLNLVFKLVNNKCYYDLKYCKKQQLVSLYYKLLSKYSFLCKSNIILDDITYIKTNITELYIDTNNNTAPTIEDPTEHEPPIGLAPVLCENSKIVNLIGFSKHIFKKEQLAGCFTDPNDLESGTVQYLKIVTLPLYNPLTLDGDIVSVGQVIDLNTIDASNGFLYQSIITPGPLVDSFTYQVSTSSFPSIYNEQIITMTIEIL